jgi:Bacterial membrane protein YfhO
MKKITLSDVLPHVLAVIIFLVVTVTFFSPIFFENKVLDQHDIQQGSAAAKSLRDYRDATGEEGLWSPSMFSGMPAYLVNVIWNNGIVSGFKTVMALYLPHPIANIFLAFVCYYILLLSFKVRPYLAIAGALAFGLSSYLIIGQMAGHNSRIGAVAFMPLVVAGIHLAFSKKRILGFGVTTLGLALQLRENHLQITYYLILIVAGYGLMQLIIAIREKQLNEFAKNIGLLIPAALIAAGTFFGQFWGITEYSRYSIRGASDLVKPGQPKQESGLTKEYAFAYNYGVGESMALLVPNIYGGSSTHAFVQDENSATRKVIMNWGNQQQAEQLANYTGAYWGPQSFTIGSYYAGAIIIFLFVAGIFFADKKYVWWLASLAVFSLMLSWGDSFKTFNYFMFDYLPGYNKFRSVNFALAIILFAMPLLGMIGLEKILTSWTNQTVKKVSIAFAITGGVCLLLFITGGFGSFLREGEAQLPALLTNALKADRISLLRSDAIRSFWFILLFFGALEGIKRLKLSDRWIGVAAIVLITIDISFVSKRYFTKDNYQRKKGNVQIEATASDTQILKDKSYYRVYKLTSWGTDALTSYYHNSINGYHGAKLRRYQDLYDSCIAQETQQLVTDAQSGQLDMKKFGVLNMLNVKYFIYGEGANEFIPNTEANGPAWFVKEVLAVNTANEELKKTVEIDTRSVAVINSQQFKAGGTTSAIDSTASIKLIEQKPYRMKYESQSAVDGVAVFSEIYYPKGWHATIDGKEVPILQADYVLRALQVPAGKHSIEFTFEPKPYTIGNKITMASSWLLLLIVLGSVGWSMKKE